MRKIKTRLKRFLLWSQKYTKADMHYIAKNGFWVVFSQFFNVISSFILLLAFANLLPKETYGTYKYILSIIGILGLFSLTGMNSAVARSIATGHEGILRPSVAYQLRWNLFMCIASLITAGYYYLHDNITLAFSLVILGFSTPMTLAFNTYGAYYEGTKRFKILNILSAFSTFIYSVSILITIFFTHNILLIATAYAISTLLPSLFFYIYTVKRYASTISDIAEVTTHGRELTYLRFIDPIVSQIDKLILGNFWGATQLATYALAQAIPMQASSFLKDWVAIGFPKFSEKNSKEIHTVFYKRILQGLSIGTLAWVIYFFISPYVFMYLLPKYLESIKYSQFFALNFIFAIPNRYVSLLFVSQKYTLILFKRTIAISILTIVLYVGMGAESGVWGLIIASVLSSAIGLILNIALWLNVQKTNT